MLHRLAIICIVGFWLAMTLLLVVRELYPESTRLNSVPLGYVGQIVFQHEQSSDLRIYSPTKSGARNEPGFLHIQPRTLLEDGQHVIEFNGSMSIALPAGRPQHLAWAGTFEMSRTFAPQRLHLDISMPESGQRSDIVVDFAGKKATFGARMGNEIVDETAFTLDEAGFNLLMSRAGIDPMMVQQLKASQSQLPQFDVSAQSSSFTVSGQKLETFLLTMKAAGQSMFEVQLSQLGQVLDARAPALGWKLTPNNLPQ